MKSRTSILEFLSQNIDPSKTSATIPLGLYCLMTGYIDSISFTATYVWCAFQTGNTIQLSLALARLYAPIGIRTYGFQLPDRLALCSLITFLLGALFGRLSSLPPFRSPLSRSWLIFSTIIQALLTMAAALCARGLDSFAVERGTSAWTGGKGFAALGFVSASLGLQAATGKKVNSQYGTSVVLTTIWVELMNDPSLPFLHHRNQARDRKLVAILLLFIGGLFSRSVLDKIGASTTLAIGAGLRVLVSASWLLVEGKVEKKKVEAAEGKEDNKEERTRLTNGSIGEAGSKKEEGNPLEEKKAEV